MRPPRAAAAFALALVLGLPPHCAAEPRPLRQIPQGRKINIAALGFVLIPTNIPKIPAAPKTPAAAAAAKAPSRALLTQAGAVGQELLRDAQGGLAPEEGRRRAAQTFDMGNSKTMTMESPVVLGKTGAAQERWPLRPAIKKSRPPKPAPSKIFQWAHRYAPAEIASTLTGLAAFYAGQAMGLSPVSSAFNCALGANLGFYGVFLNQEMRRDGEKARRSKQKHKPLATVRNLLIELGPAELLDIGLRPFFLWLMLQKFPGYIGVLSGKILADLSFFVPAIAIFELRKKYARYFKF